MVPLRRGGAVLRELLATHLRDVRELEEADFPGWLELHLKAWRADPAFLQRVLIRDLRLANPELQALEAERREARRAYESSEGQHEIERLRRELAGAQKAVAGLTHAIARADDQAEARRLSAKLQGFRGRTAALDAELDERTASSLEWRALQDVSRRLAGLRAQVGFDREVQALERMHRRQGRSSGRSGADFEGAAVEAVTRVVLPELHPSEGAPPPVVLRSVTLGAARTEIDQLVVRPSARADQPVEVLALVEAKRNPNDLAHGLRRRLENLAWLAGHREGYDPEAYRTASFASGHFDRDAHHREAGAVHRLDHTSFRRFLPALTAGELPAGLYLVTRTGPLWGLGSDALARIGHRISTDLAWAPGDPGYMAGLLEWCQALAHALEAPEVLRGHAADPAAANRVLFLDPRPAQGGDGDESNRPD
jgi:hypothetical protein